MAPSQLVAVNRTIDDEYDDSSSGVRPTYLPADAWKLGSTCTDCSLHPNPALAHNSTWHDAQLPAQLTLQFVGTAIYVYCILPPTTATSIAYALDGGASTGSADFVPDGAFQYAVPVVSLAGLQNTNHSLVVSTNSSAFLFDYAVYTTLEQAQSPAIASPTLAASSLDKTLVGTFAGCILGVVVLLGAVLTFILRFRKGRRTKDHASDDHERRRSNSTKRTSRSRSRTRTSSTRTRPRTMPMSTVDGSPSASRPHPRPRALDLALVRRGSDSSESISSVLVAYKTAAARDTATDPTAMSPKPYNLNRELDFGLRPEDLRELPSHPPPAFRFPAPPTVPYQPPSPTAVPQLPSPLPRSSIGIPASSSTSSSQQPALPLSLPLSLSSPVYSEHWQPVSNSLSPTFTSPSQLQPPPGRVRFALPARQRHTLPASGAGFTSISRSISTICETPPPVYRSGRSSYAEQQQ